jgi:hypothetical protein
LWKVCCTNYIQENATFKVLRGMRAKTSHVQKHAERGMNAITIPTGVKVCPTGYYSKHTATCGEITESQVGLMAIIF